MEENVNAIVLKVVKYNDKTYIADLLTEHHGRMSFAVPAPATGKNSLHNRTLWRPLNMVEFECDLKKRRGLPRPKDATLSYNYSSLSYNPIKAMMAIYIDELLCSAIWNEVPDEPLFRFVRKSLIVLDTKQEKFVNFHIAFSVNLLENIGIQPNVCRRTIDLHFDMRAAEFTPLHPLHDDVISGIEADALEKVMRINFDNMHLFKFNRNQIQRILHLINVYYMIHVPNFRQLKAIEIFGDALS